MIDNCKNIMGILLLYVMSQRVQTYQKNFEPNSLDIEDCNMIQNYDDLKNSYSIQNMESNKVTSNYNNINFLFFNDVENLEVNCQLEVIFSELIDTLHRMSRHVYLSKNLALHALSVLIHLLKFCNYRSSDDHMIDNRMFGSLVTYIKKLSNELNEDILIFILRILSDKNVERRLYLCIISLLGELLQMRNLDSSIFTTILQINLRQILEENVIGFESICLFAVFIQYRPHLIQKLHNIISILAQQNYEISQKDFELFEINKWLIFSRLLRFENNQLINQQILNLNDQLNMKEIDHIKRNDDDDYNYQPKFELNEEQISNISNMLINDANTVPDMCIIYLIDCLDYLIHKFDEDKRLTMLDILWRRILILDSRIVYRSVMHSFAKTIFNEENIFNFKLTVASQKFITDCLDVCLQKYEEKPRLLITFLRPLLKKECLVCIVTKECSFLLQYVAPLLYMGSKPNKAIKFLGIIEQIALNRNLSPNPILLSVDSKKTRYNLYGCLLQLEADPRNHDTTLAYELLLHLKEILNGSYKDRYYGNSQIHVKRHRLLFIFMCLHKFLLLDANVWLHYFVEMLSLFDQPSVRFLIEWLIFIIGKHHEVSFLYILNCLDKADGGFPSQVGSLLYLVAQIAPYHSLHIVESLNIITLWCGVSNSSVRCQAQASLLYLSNKCQQPINNHINKQAHFINNHKKQHSGCFKILLSFKYTINLETDFNIQMIGCNVSREFGYDDCLDFDFFVETIKPMSFLYCSIPIFFNNQQSVAIQNIKLTKMPFENLEQDTETNKNSTFQKKMVPNKHVLGFSSALHYEDRGFNTLKSNSFEEKKEADSFILIASLVTSPSNLGGLCRTCEVFGVNKLVISNLDVFKHESFLSLSLTSQQWMPIQQVGEADLGEYLLQLKLWGFKIFALEQTNDSHNLNDFTFPPRTALLLGNERSGIDGRLLMLVDGCVEIQQSGIIRSLNVHVAAAIAIARYRAITPKILKA